MPANAILRSEVKLPKDKRPRADQLNSALAGQPNQFGTS
jgi:hypothetical protein